MKPWQTLAFWPTAVAFVLALTYAWLRLPTDQRIGFVVRVAMPIAGFSSLTSAAWATFDHESTMTVLAYVLIGFGALATWVGSNHSMRVVFGIGTVSLMLGVLTLLAF